MYSEKNYIMWLNSLVKINIETKRNLIDALGSAEAIWEADKISLLDIGFLSADEVNIILNDRYKYDMDLELERLYQSDGEFYVPSDKGYPSGLDAMMDPPLGLYIAGDIANLSNTMVSIVGSRRITDYGATVCHTIAKELAGFGIGVVSGMAMGIDAVAHKAALEAGGKTIAVMGTGIDVCYPMVNRNIYSEIIRKGCVISEYPLGTKALPFHFPWRNRIIACLSKATLVVEAAEKSGSIITAGKALDNGRIVMAVPGNITSKLSTGCNNLIKQGCVPVTCTQDILDELNIKINNKEIKSENSTIPLADDEEKLYACIGDEPVTSDELIDKLNMDTGNVACLLTMLELKGLIRRLSGQKVVRNF